MRARVAITLFLLLFVVAAAVQVAGVLSGSLHIGFFLLFPVIYGTGFTPLIAFILVIIAFMILFFIPFSAYEREPAHYEYEEQPVQYVEREPPPLQQSREFGGVIFIGPIPIVFGSSRRMTRYMIIAAAAVALLLSIYFLLLFFK
jgi:uncharacterized protein (TIGR00304 family)